MGMDYVAHLESEVNDARAEEVAAWEQVNELERENERLRAERDGWTREWRAQAEGEDSGTVSPWFDSESSAEIWAEPFRDSDLHGWTEDVWLERRWCSPPERVSEDEGTTAPVTAGTYRDTQDGCLFIVEEVSSDGYEVRGRREFVEGRGIFEPWGASVQNFKRFYRRVSEEDEG